MSDEMREQQAFVLEAQEFCTGLLRPGAQPAEIWELYNAFMREHRWRRRGASTSTGTATTWSSGR